MKNILICAILAAQILSCSTGSDPDQSDPKLSFSKKVVSLSNGSTKDISLKLNDFTTKIFALSMQLPFDPDIISINESTGFSVGDFFDQNEISLLKIEGNTIHLSISLTQGTAPVKGSGVLGTFTLNGIAVGNCVLTIDEDELIFYDESGDAIEIEDLELGLTTIKVE